MTAKEFFKSTAFKCIAVLLSIVLICGILLTLCNALLYVTDDERTARAVAKVFPDEEVTFEEDEVDENYAETANYRVEQAFTLTGEREGQYLLSIIGKNGYNSGTVTCWVVALTEDNAFAGLEKLVVTGNEKQSFINKIGDSDIQAVIDGQNEDGFTAYSSSGISTGATFSLGAIANAMNGAKDYVESVYCGVVNPYADWTANTNITSATTYTVENGVVTYNIITAANSPAPSITIEIVVGADKTITSFTTKSDTTHSWSTENVYTDFAGKGADFFAGVIGENGDISNNSNYAANGIAIGATRSNYLLLSAALFATANYDRAVAQYAEGGAE